MKERPILFSGPMVRAILEGRKTQTRRVAKTDGLDLVGPCGNSLTGDLFLVGRDWPGNTVTVKCPYTVGDRLWVRETFADARKMWGQVFYRADNAEKYDSDGAWTPSIHMPRWASRLTLEITAVRVERLQDITEEDAKAEGVERNANADGSSSDSDGWLDYVDLAAGGAGFPVETAHESFCSLWSFINGRGSWDANPYVWVVEFRKVEDKR